jgi:hypothetical protein
MDEANKRKPDLRHNQSSIRVASSSLPEMSRGSKARLHSASRVTSGSKVPKPTALLQRKTRPRRRRYPLNRIKQGCCYDLHEIGKLLDVHPNTIRHWLKNGLDAIDARRPILVHGATLRTFIALRQQARRQKCGPSELFCFRCRAPRGAWGDAADVTIISEKLARLSALCSVCETAMHRTIRRADIPKIGDLIDLQTMASERIRESPDAIPNCHFEKD